MNEGLGTIIDIYKLRAAFNAQAQFSDRGAVERLLEATKRFENIITHYYHEYPNLPENLDVIRKAEVELARVAVLAEALKAEGMVLPVPAESPDAALVGTIVRNIDPAVQFHLPLR